MSSVQLACVPVSGGALDEISAHTQYGHGLPLTYYYDQVPANCGVSNASSLVGTVAVQGWQGWALLADIIVWGALSTRLVVALLWQRRRRQTKRTGATA
jgi:hypothetical protein